MWRRAGKLARLTIADWRIAVQAAMLAAVAPIAVRSIGVDRTLRLTRGWRSMRARHPPAEVTSRVVHAVTSRLGARCLTQSIVLHSLLARSGYETEVVLGASMQSGGFRAHAWVERDGQVISAGGAAGCQPLHRFGPARQNEAAP